jgi:hypothetical protein
MEANPFLSELASQVVISMVPVAIGALAYLVRWVTNYIKARVAAEHYQILSDLARQAVTSVEQTMRSRQNQEKLSAAKAVVESALLAKGIRLDEQAIVSAIEAAVATELWRVEMPFVEDKAGASDAMPEVDSAADGEIAGDAA